jgi:hypothetical protein
MGDQHDQSFRVSLPDIEQGTHWMVQVVDARQATNLDPTCRHCRLDVPEWRYCGGDNFGIRFPNEKNIRQRSNSIPTEAPIIGADRNSEERRERVVLDPAGAAHVEGTVTWGAQLEQEQRDLWSDLSVPARVEKFLETETGAIESPDVTIGDPDDMGKPLTTKFAYTARDWTTAAEGGLVLHPRDRMSAKLGLPLDETRRAPLWWPRPFRLRTESALVLPANIKPARLPSPVELKGPGLRFTSRWSTGAAPGEIVWTREFAAEKGTIPVADYPAYREFAIAMRRALDAEVELPRPTEGK